MKTHELKPPKKLTFKQLLKKHNAPQISKANRVTIIRILDLGHYKEQDDDSKPFIRSAYRRRWIEASETMHALSGRVIWKLTYEGRQIAQAVAHFDEELKYQREHGHGFIPAT